MKNRSIILVLCTLCSTGCYARWVPTFRDAPVPPALVADVEKALPEAAIVDLKDVRRVFYTSFGHNNHIYTNRLMLKHSLAGIQFATGDLEADTTSSGGRSALRKLLCCEY